MKVENIAQICHEANRSLCNLFDDYSQKEWRDAEQWQRDSAIEGVVWRLKNTYASVSAQHEQWKESKIRDGWVYGRVKDPQNKKHPCLVDFNDLPEHQQAKDVLFTSIVNGLSRYVK